MHAAAWQILPATSTPPLLGRKTCATSRAALALQGIKFFDPEIVGDTPETVELVGVRNLVQAAQEHLGFTEGKVIFAPSGAVSSRA